MRILCVDDHAIFRQGVRQILARSAAPFHFGEASSARETLESLTRERWDLVLLDLSLPDRGGLDLLVQIRRDWPEIPVIVLTMHQEEDYALRALRNGAAGYVTKDTAPADLLAAVDRVSDGGRYISASVAERIAMSLSSDQPRELHERLSTRELEVLRLIGQGKSLKEIAAIMSLSVKSVGTYRARLLEKMNMSSNADLVRYLVEHHLLP
ncbi:MAG TPA: response regulator transcription factor [Thermoanaerobaculia bacterium]|nr:response regulator transcription factor [Thermoanaerobaculia bacterium]